MGKLTTTTNTDISPVDYLDTKQYTPIQYSEPLMAALPAGVELKAYKLNIGNADYWSADKDKANFLNKNEIMPSAHLLKRIGQASGVTLRKVTDRVDEFEDFNERGQVIKTRTLLIEYEATMMLADGTVVSDTGGKEEKYTPGVGHSREKIDTKARRNALATLMAVPKKMTIDDLKKPLIVFKPVFNRGGEVDHIVEAIEGKQNRAIASLYGDTTTESEIIDAVMTETEQPAEVETPDFKLAIEGCQTVADLEAIGEMIKGFELSDDQRAELIGAYKSKAAELKTKGDDDA